MLDDKVTNLAPGKGNIWENGLKEVTKYELKPVRVRIVDDE